MKSETGGPAFDDNDGLTKRDYFAAAILPAIFTSYAPIADPGVNEILVIAKSAYEIADAMLKVRTNEQ